MRSLSKVLLFPLAAVVLGGPALAAGGVTKEKCVAAGNTPEACDCFIGQVEKQAKASSGKEGNFGAVMGALVQATDEAAKKCGVKLK